MTTRKKKVKEKPVVRRGTGKPMYGSAYPKRYSVEIEHNENADGIVITRKCENMTAWELYGVLRVLTLEVEEQMRLKPKNEKEKLQLD